MKSFLLPAYRAAFLVFGGLSGLFVCSLAEGAIPLLLSLGGALLFGLLSRAFYCSAERLQRRAARANARTLRRKSRAVLRRRACLTTVQGGRSRVSVA